MYQLFKFFSLREQGVFEKDEKVTPMLFINGSDDIHVLQAETLIFKVRPNTDVYLIPNTGHCATSKLPEVFPIIYKWLKDQMTS